MDATSASMTTSPLALAESQLSMLSAVAFKASTAAVAKAFKSKLKESKLIFIIYFALV